MRRFNLSVGYRLIADDGKDLITRDSEGFELIRTKSVDIPSGETSLNWVEVDEKPPEVEQLPSEDELRKQRIEELRRQLAELEASPI